MPLNDAVQRVPSKVGYWLLGGLALVFAVLISCSDTSTAPPAPPTVSQTTKVPAVITTTPVPKVATPTQRPLPRTPSPPAPVTPPPSTSEIVPPPRQVEARDIRLEVSEPSDESVFSTSPVSVRGMVDLDAVVSVNGNIVALADDGSFNITITLLEGPNPIEIVATNTEGRASSQILTVMYIP